MPECLLHCLLNIPRNIGDAFFYVITCVYTSWKTVVLLFLFHVLDCNAIFANQDLLPTLRPGNFDLHTKMPGSAPAWAVVDKCPVCADLLLVGRRSERLCRRLVNNHSPKWGSNRAPYLLFTDTHYMFMAKKTSAIEKVAKTFATTCSGNKKIFCKVFVNLLVCPPFTFYLEVNSATLSWAEGTNQTSGKPL